MLVKFISEKQIKYFPGWIKENGVVFTNKSAEEKAHLYGYKELVSDVPPEIDYNTQYTIPYYIDEDTCVRKSWEVMAMEQEVST